jgi:hypothetical protein
MTGRHLSLASLFFCRLTCLWASIASVVSLGCSGRKSCTGDLAGFASGEHAGCSPWETIFPAEILEGEGNGPETGRAARDSGKSLKCARRKTYSYLRILVGGQKPVANGPIAIVHFKIRPEAHAGATNVRVERAPAVTADLKQLTLKEAEGTVTIHSS